MVNYLAELRELKPKCLLVKGYKEQADVNKNPGKTQEVERHQVPEKAPVRQASQNTGTA